MSCVGWYKHTCCLISLSNGLTQGTLLEKFLTQSPSDFLRLTRSFNVPTGLAEESKREAYRYAKVSLRFVLVPHSQYFLLVR
jgi:hypothetical protein